MILIIVQFFTMCATMVPNHHNMYLKYSTPPNSVRLPPENKPEQARIHFTPSDKYHEPRRVLSKEVTSQFATQSRN